MKKYIFKLLALFLPALVLFSCEKENNPTEIELPTQINFGESKIYLNGELKPGFKTFIDYTKSIEDFGFSFVEDVSPRLSHGIGFNWMPLKEGRFPIGKPGIFHEVVPASFSQSLEEDLPAYEYELIEPENGYFEIEQLDTIKQEVKGHFKAKFRRTTTNGNKDLGLPKIILMQGIFYEHYEVF